MLSRSAAVPSLPPYFGVILVVFQMLGLNFFLVLKVITSVLRQMFIVVLAGAGSDLFPILFSVAAVFFQMKLRL